MRRPQKLFATEAANSPILSPLHSMSQNKINNRYATEATPGGTQQSDLAKNESGQTEPQFERHRSMAPKNQSNLKLEKIDRRQLRNSVVFNMAHLDSQRKKLTEEIEKTRSPDARTKDLLVNQFIQSSPRRTEKVQQSLKQKLRSHNLKFVEKRGENAILATSKSYNLKDGADGRNGVAQML